MDAYPQQIKYCLSLFGENDPVKVFDVGYHQTPPLHAYGPAVRPYYLLHLIESGKGYIERGGVKTYLSAGDAFLIVPDEVTLYCADETEPWTYSWISFNGSFCKTLVEKSTDKLCMKYQKSGLLALRTVLEKGFNDYLGCLNAFFEILNSIKTLSQRQGEEDGFSAVLRYLENNYFYPVDVASLAQSFGYSRAYFSTLFLKRTGETPHGYLTKIRIEKAKAYLESETYSVEEIAYSVGFASLQRFCEAFKKRTGFTPTQYRKRFTDK